MSSTTAALVRSGYAESGLGTRAHVRGRQYVAPFDQLAALLPPAGHLLEIGCGTGVFSLHLALGSADRTVHGVDIDGPRVRQARAAAARLGIDRRVQFDQVEPGWLPVADAYDGIVVSDVLYLFEPASIDEVVSASCDSLRPGGELVVKELETTPRWKHRFGVAQELIAVRLLGFTKGTAFTTDPLGRVRGALDRRGWPYRTVAMDRGYPYAHTALVATSPR